MTPLPTTRIAIHVPEIGAGTEQLRISSWFVEAGQSVVAGDPVVEVLIRGITFDIAAPQTGRLVETTRSIDAAVNPGEVLGWIVTEG
jgi:pyruvate/2-oxoglutarate dehydrogenase complex dihydrolipoamide acyltransferase (E2) component